MPLTYKRKGYVSRGKWCATSLIQAVKSISTGMGISEAARVYNIPKTTLLRRLKNKIFTKEDVLGPSSVLTPENEKKIVAHINKLQKRGFTPSRETVCRMAYDLAESLGIKHTFNKEKKKAGQGWLYNFMNRNPELAIRKSEGISLARARGMNKDSVENYFSLLEKTLQENELFDKPGSIYNMDETGLQLNNKPDKVIAIKGSKNIPSITASEKGETISVIACCNGEGTFLPPYCIFKGKLKKPEFEDGMPPGSVVTMSQKSAYVNSDIFFDWLKNHFVPRKSAGTCVLILDGHSSHCNNFEMLEFAEDNNIILICLPSHTTHFLQPLDRAFFKSLKTYYYAECKRFLLTNPNRKLTRLQFGKILAVAWNKSASVNNAVSGFSATGIVPLNKHAIPEYAFLVSDNSNEPNTSNITAHVQSTSFEFTAPQTEDEQNLEKKNKVTPKKLTPGKILDKISPIPEINKTTSLRQRSRKLAEILNSPENIQKMKAKAIKKDEIKIKQEGNKKKATKRFVSKNTEIKPDLNEMKQTKGTKRQKKEDSSNDEDTLRDSPEILEWNDNECAGCGENYEDTRSREDWLCCVICERWSHDGCTEYDMMCQRCGDTFNP